MFPLPLFLFPPKSFITPRTSSLHSSVLNGLSQAWRLRSRPMPRRASASAVLLASVGACLRHLPPSLHSASVTPVPILFTICTQKPRQPQTMYLICTHVVCTRAIYQTYKKCKDLWWCRCALCRSAVENYHTIPHLSILSPSLFSLLFPLRGFQTNDYIIRQRICSL